MEKLNYKGQEFLYVIEEYDCGEYGMTCYKTMKLVNRQKEIEQGDLV